MVAGAFGALGTHSSVGVLNLPHIPINRKVEGCLDVQHLAIKITYIMLEIEPIISDIDTIRHKVTSDMKQMREAVHSFINEYVTPKL
jgi:hypothetical protein